MNTVAYILLCMVAYLMPDTCDTADMDDETLACYIAHRDMMAEGWL